jgi:hypothetical protein
LSAGFREPGGRQRMEADMYKLNLGWFWGALLAVAAA